jgi:hypothetical protein
MKQREANIPLVIRKLYPRMRLKDYETLRYNEAFLAKKIFVCYNCYLELTESRPLAGKLTEPANPIDDTGMFDLMRVKRDSQDPALKLRNLRSSAKLDGLLVKLGLKTEENKVIVKRQEQILEELKQDSFIVEEVAPPKPPVTTKSPKKFRMKFFKMERSISSNMQSHSTMETHSHIREKSLDRDSTFQSMTFKKEDKVEHRTKIAKGIILEEDKNELDASTLSYEGDSKMKPEKPRFRSPQPVRSPTKLMSLPARNQVSHSV